jgi:dolichol-phosphate mannosyltransferase
MDGRSPDTGTPGWSLSLVIPAFNEEAGIRQAIGEADDALSRLGSPYEIIVVDDGSHDATSAVVAAHAASRPHVRLLRHAENLGYGAALRTGFQAAHFDRVAFTDADCQFDLLDLASLVPLTDQYPVAVGYRADRQDSWHRRFYSWGYNRLVRAVLGTGVRDCDCALKVFRKEALAELLPEASGFFVNAEMLTRARQRNMAVAEVGVHHRPRLAGASKVSLLDVPRVLRTLVPFWWSRVLFAATPGDDAETQTSWPRLHEVALATLMVVALLLFFSRLRCPLLEPEEARYAEIPRQMLAEGRWVVPVLHGEPYYQKPPLLYWLVMAGYQLLGVHDWVARLVPSAAAFLSVLTVYAWAKRVVGVRAAFAGALMLCLSARFVYVGRMVTMDSLLTFCVVAAWAGAHLALRGPGVVWRWWLLSAVACGLGVLTKGPVALVLVAVPALAFQLLDLRAPRLRALPWLVYLGVTGAVAFPWYVAVSVYDPVFLTDFLWTHNVLRFVTPFDHTGPPWYYLPGLLLGMLPWTFLLPAMAKLLAAHAPTIAARRPAGLGFFLLAALWCLAFFSMAGCKRPAYILPAMPPLALALGCYLDLVLPRNTFQRARAALVAHTHLAHGATLVVLTAGLGGSMLAVGAGLQKPAHGAVLAALVVLGLAVLLRRGPDRRTGISWVVCGAVTFGLLLAAVHDVLPGYVRKFSLRAQVRPQRDLGVDPDVPVVCYPHRWDSVSFYLGRNDVRAYHAGERARLIADLRARSNTLLFIKSDTLDGLLRDLPVSLEFVPRAKNGMITAGLVCRRAEAPQSLFARR